MKFNKPLRRTLSMYLIFALLIISLPAQGWAMFIPTGQAAPTREADLETIQKTLESAVVKQRLMDYGLSSKEAMARINKLSDEQIHQFATHTESIQAGGDPLDVFIGLLVIVALVVLLVYLLKGRIEVR